jgi:hypothetical protein
VHNITSWEPISKPEGPFGKHTMMKSNAQLPRHVDSAEHAPPIHPRPSATSSSQAARPPATFEEMYSRLSAQMTTGFQQIDENLTSGFEPLRMVFGYWKQKWSRSILM